MWEKAQTLPRYAPVFQKPSLDEALLNRIGEPEPHPSLAVTRALLVWPRCLHDERTPRPIGDLPESLPDQEALARATLAAFQGR
ncbi:MAG: hypothetical protein PVI57_02910 [Gemmatimonadota bacterium]|jgi:hypothetical protein